MTSKDRILQALADLDKAHVDVIGYLLSCRYEGHSPSDPNKRGYINFYDRKTNELVLETEAEVLAIYYRPHRIWTWAWALPLLESENHISKELVIFALRLENSLTYIRMILTTSRCIIHDRVQKDINQAIALSYVKKYCIPIPNKSDDGELTLTYYLLLNTKKIEELKMTKGNG